MKRLAAPLLIAAVLAAAAGGSQAAFPGKAGKLVFQSKRDGSYELYVANANGSGVKKLLSRPQTDEFNANWSPTGTKIVFQTGPADGSDFDLWLVGAGGRDARPILSGKTNDRAPQFCDVRTVVFTRQLSPTSSDVYSLDLHTRRVRRLTSHPSTDSFPTCHPTRDEIAFISAREGGVPRIYVMTRAGARQRPLVPGPSLDPDYSSDGKALAYVAPDADRNLEVFAMNLATGAVTQRTNVRAPLEFRLPKFAPVATRSSSARFDEDDELVATQRDTSTTPAKEAVFEVVAGGTRPAADPASGGAPGPTSIARCRCRHIDAEIARAVRHVEGNTLVVTVDLERTISCTHGVQGCDGLTMLVPPRKFRVLGGSVPVDCTGNCAKSSSDQVKYELNSAVPNADQGGIVLRIQFVCEARRTQQLYKLVFRPGGKILDREKSDLNGNRVPDGKEK
jgi:hypothetical protein